MTEIGSQLERLGLEQYHDALVGEGFDTWETLLDITESDLDALGVRLGHRRKLQRAIAEYRGFSSDRPLGSPSLEGQADSTRSSEAGVQPGAGREGLSVQGPEQKRKYRRHPKPDENAPEKPPSAYVIFSNKVREEVKGESLSFTEIARLVGERWQKLDPNQKEPYESQASTLKESYLIQLSEYKKTDAYRDYLQYLADFKAKHGQATDSKRLKLDFQSSSSTSGYGQESDISSQGPRHTRGGSLGSMSTTSQGAPLPSPAGIALAPASSLPNLNTSVNRHLELAARRTSPSHFPHDVRLPRDLSSQSSVSEESVAARLDQLEALSRTATLSLSTPPAMTPPLPSSASVGGKSDHGSTAETIPWNQRPPHSGQTYPSTSSTSPSNRMSTPTTVSSSGETWRERTNESGRQAYHSHNHPSHLQPGSMPISQLLGSEHGLELSHAQAQRTLPPLRRLPSVPTGQSASLPPFSNPGNVQQRESAESGPGQRDESQQPRGRSENEAAAASVLAGLAQRQAQNPSNPSSHHQVRR